MTWDPQSGQWVGAPQGQQPQQPSYPQPAGQPPVPGQPAGYPQQYPQAPNPQGQYPQTSYPPQYQQQYPPGQYPQPMAPAVPRPNPFAGVPVADFVRDGVAVLLLIVSLFFPADMAHNATDRVEVVLITIVSILSVGITYVARAGVLGASFAGARAGVLRLIANLPYFLMFVVFVLADLVVGGDYNFSGGVGAALGLGLAGAILIVQPRQVEVAQGGPLPLGRLWQMVAVGLAGVAAFTVLFGLVVFFVHRDLSEITGTQILALVLSQLLGVVIIGIPAVGLLGKHPSWRYVLVLVGGSVVGLYLLAKADAAAADLYDLIHFLSAGLVYWPAIAAAAAALTVRAAMRPEPEPWAAAAKNLLGLGAVVAGITLVISLLNVIDAHEKLGPVIAMVLWMLYAGVAVMGRVLIARPGSRMLGLGAAGVLLLLGVIELIVGANSDYLAVLPGDQLLALVVPFGIAGFLGVPMLLEARARGGAPAQAVGYPAGYQAPQVQYQTPPVQFQAPQVQYQTPPVQYQAPQVPYQAPQAEYQVPQAAYQAPAAPPPPSPAPLVAAAPSAVAEALAAPQAVGVPSPLPEAVVEPATEPATTETEPPPEV